MQELESRLLHKGLALPDNDLEIAFSPSDPDDMRLEQVNDRASCDGAAPLKVEAAQTLDD